MPGSPPVVDTGQGRLSGRSEDPAVNVFLGVPYAAPPVGKLRWRPPQPSAPWLGLREAVEFGSDPIQPPGLRTTRASGQSEDCLYLNVWAPKERQHGGWPVMVWLCGGGFTMGSGAFAEEDPGRLAARGAVIVSVNIRLNAFGFLAHPGLSAESPHGSSGNYGLLDLAAALRWTRENIEAFGGDPRRVTFFGESAGATVGLLLQTSPAVHKPYDRAILQSPGSFDALLGREEAERHGAGLGGSLEELRRLTTTDLVDRASRLTPVSPTLWLARPLRPIVDGWVIQQDDPLNAPDFVPVPSILGTNEDEGRFFQPRMRVRTPSELLTFAETIFGHGAEDAIGWYAAASLGEVSAIFSAMFGDRAFNLPIARLARGFAQRSGELYRYVYSYRHGALAGAPTHSEENGVLMDLLPRVREQDAEMTEILASSWLAFAEQGTPNGSTRATWPRLDPEGDMYFALDVPPQTGSAWRREHLDFMSKNLVGAKALTLRSSLSPSPTLGQLTGR